MYLWVYLVFFNMLWVVMPIYALQVAYKDICEALSIRGEVARARYALGVEKETDKTK